MSAHQIKIPWHSQKRLFHAKNWITHAQISLEISGILSRKQALAAQIEERTGENLNFNTKTAAYLNQ